jgi:hypothetical protein
MRRLIITKGIPLQDIWLLLAAFLRHQCRHRTSALPPEDPMHLHIRSGVDCHTHLSSSSVSSSFTEDDINFNPLDRDRPYFGAQIFSAIRKHASRRSRRHRCGRHHLLCSVTDPGRHHLSPPRVRPRLWLALPAYPLRCPHRRRRVPTDHLLQR